MKFGLENISRLCAALDHPERRFSSVIVAGTNGKGSVTAMVHRGLLAAGHRTARYTSPHLERLEERYVIGASEVERPALEAAADEVRAAVTRMIDAGDLEAPPTFFECATAIAFVLFAAARVEIAVLEVGLGGRLDATNVVTPIAAAITSIDFDHQAQLGSTLTSIAFEKAGVIKPGIPVVCGPLPADAEVVIRGACRERGARYVEARASALGDIAPALPGRHQRDNAAVAATLMTELDALGVTVPDAALRAGIADVSWPGRLERFRCGTADVLIDAAHNPAGAAALTSYLRETRWDDAVLVTGMMQDKDVTMMLRTLAPAFGTVICTTPGTPRAMPADALADVARKAGSWRVETVADPSEALAAACARFPRVVAAGSIFLIGPLRGILRTR